ncbi:aspartate aminotransferase (plasmid) [Ketogulonicigenium robustum]|uniref:Aminotransferase n=1 Tax=Ketogulonicigenium robustum TaxID=92947 RepID=A0A1W6P3C3_9RHOB|nr:pyridoxal phosphate-dependent aminotransferase [Ketogulonicigenium robustum]ARO15913.1 aspartate aminotransferase [Ketogulonicigenium robustum]
MTDTFRPAARLEGLAVSEILRIGARAKALADAGHPVIVLGAGEPDFDTPLHVKAAGVAAIEGGDTKYTALDGTPALKAAICAKLQRENGLTYTPAEVTVAAGAKQIIYNAMMATLDAGDEVIIPTPYWTTYSAIVKIAGGVPVLIPCDDSVGFKLQPAALAAAITPKTRWLMLNTPSNPTGAAYDAAELQALIDVLKTAPQVWLMTDEIYEHITYDGFKCVSPVAVDSAIRPRCLIVNGVSKAYAMTGWRIGYGAGPAALIKAMAVVQSQATSNPASMAQAAAVAALNGPQDEVAARAASFAARRDLVVQRLNAIDGITCRQPEGAFYAFASCAGLIGARTPSGDVLASDRDFCSWLLESSYVATVPGAAFGLQPYFRISYATAMAELEEALDRIAAACSTLTRA